MQKVTETDYGEGERGRELERREIEKQRLRSNGSVPYGFKS